MKIRSTVLEIWWKIRWSSRATSFLHFLAMNAPFNSWRILFYKLRGTSIGRNVYIVQGCFLEESRPWLIEIQDNVRIGAGVILVTHDGVYYGYDNCIPYRYGKIVVKRNATICPGSIILPGVKIGESAVVSPGSLVNRDVPDAVIVGGVPAQKIMTLEEGLDKSRMKSNEYRQIDKQTKYPWAIKKDT